jgi:GNAT superfamily N-acetyltransferase
VTVNIRTARLSDAADIARLTAHLGYDVESSALSGRLARILARSDQRLLLAELDGQVVGWLHAVVFEEIEAPPYVVVAGLVVDRSHRRLGIGRTLIAECEEWAKGRQCSVVRLWSSAGRTAAHRFYERLGYTNIKTQYSFVKSLGRDRGDFSGFIPRIDGESS